LQSLVLNETKFPEAESVTSVASEAFALLNRPSPSSRTASSKSGQPDGGFADLIESQAESHDTPKAARPERNERLAARRTERDTPADKPVPAESTRNEAKVAETVEDSAERTAVTGSEPDSADESAPAAEDGANAPLVPTGIVPVLSVDLTAVAPAIAVAAPVTAAPVESPAAPTEVAPLPTAATPVPAVVPAPATPNTAPHQQQQTDATGETAAPAVPAATAAVAGQETAAANAAPLAKAQSAARTEKQSAGDATTDTETSVETAQAETPGDAAKHPKQPATQNVATAQAQAGPDKPDLKTDQAFKPDDVAAAPKFNADYTSSQVLTQTPAHATGATAATLQASPVSTAQAVPVNAIAIEIAGQAKAGNSRFEIRLDPPELGRIDVRLDVDRDGNVTSRLVIERADTYDLLRRDQSTLERALQQAGLKTSDNALEFSLRDQGFAQQQRQNDDTPRGVRALIAESDVMPSEAANGYARLLGGRSGVDIRV
jgi:flagellar hook-length control protein FliK